MSAGGFKKINNTIAKLWVETAARDTLRDLVDEQQQQLYITPGAIRKAMQLQRAAQTADDLSIGELNRTTKDTPKRDFTAISNQIFKELLVATKGLSKRFHAEVYTSKGMINIVGTFSQIKSIKSHLQNSISTGQAAKDFLKVTQLGHTVGVGSIGALAIQQLASGMNIEIPAETQRDLDFILDMEYDAILHNHIQRFSGIKSRISLTLELDLNTRRGSATSGASARLKEWFRKNLAKKLTDNPLDSASFGNLLTTTGLSTSMEDDLLAITAALFKGKPVKDSKKTRKAKKATKSKKAAGAKNTGIALKVKSKKKATPTNTLFGNLLHLQNIINLKMHETLKNEVMGQGNDPVALNYRTGRFARSARVEQLMPAKGGLSAQITWQRYPYDTFAPGGKLHMPMRDPNFLIGQSIREILREVGLQQIMISTRSS